MGFTSALDKTNIDRGALASNFDRNVVESPDFRDRKRINELFDLNKVSAIDKDMTPQRILLWANSLLKSFGVNIKADNAKYKLEDKIGLVELIKRKNEAGKYFVDGENLLGQIKGKADLFIDEETGRVSKTKDACDTSKLDAGIVDIDLAFKLAEFEGYCCLSGCCQKCKPHKASWRKM